MRRFIVTCKGRIPSKQIKLKSIENEASEGYFVDIY